MKYLKYFFVRCQKIFLLIQLFVQMDTFMKNNSLKIGFKLRRHRHKLIKFWLTKKFYQMDLLNKKSI